MGAREALLGVAPVAPPRLQAAAAAAAAAIEARDASDTSDDAADDAADDDDDEDDDEDVATDVADDEADDEAEFNGFESDMSLATEPPLALVPVPTTSGRLLVGTIVGVVNEETFFAGGASVCGSTTRS